MSTHIVQVAFREIKLLFAAISPSRNFEASSEHLQSRNMTVRSMLLDCSILPKSSVFSREIASENTSKSFVVLFAANPLRIASPGFVVLTPFLHGETCTVLVYGGVVSMRAFQFSDDETFERLFWLN
jgi:hypothetical protein